MKYIVRTELDMICLAEKVAKKITNGSIVTLNGDLGAGKTFFVGAFINYFYKFENKTPINVTSPTFNLLKIYNTNNFTIYHFDLYRIKKQEELYELDFDSAFENISLIEWPGIACNILPKNTIDIDIKLIDGYREVIINNLQF